MRSSSRTRTRTTATAVGAALLSCAALAGCGGAEAGPTPAPTATSLPLPSPAPPSPGQIVEQQITDAVTRYDEVATSLFTNPAADLAVIETVATADEATSLRSQVEQIRAARLQVTGAVNLATVRVTDFQPSAAESAVTAAARVCQDVSTYKVARPDGTSDIDPQRLDRTLAEMTLTNITPGDASGWRVSLSSNNSRTACDPS